MNIVVDSKVEAKKRTKPSLVIEKISPKNGTLIMQNTNK